VYQPITGSYAEYTLANIGRAYALPDSVSTRLASASVIQGLTALTLVRDAHETKKGEWVLVHAAAGGTGQWLVSFLKDIGARVIATASTDEKLEIAKKLGAEFLINYSKGSWKEKVLELTNNEGVAAVFDGVGKATFEDDLEVMAVKGSLVSFGNASGAVPPFNIL
jgi:NADPH2:quinone reductase